MASVLRGIDILLHVGINMWICYVGCEAPNKIFQLAVQLLDCLWVQGTALHNTQHWNHQFWHRLMWSSHWTLLRYAIFSDVLPSPGNVTSMKPKVSEMFFIALQTWMDKWLKIQSNFTELMVPWAPRSPGGTPTRWMIWPLSEGSWQGHQQGLGCCQLPTSASTNCWVSEIQDLIFHQMSYDTCVGKPTRRTCVGTNQWPPSPPSRDGQYSDPNLVCYVYSRCNVVAVLAHPVDIVVVDVVIIVVLLGSLR